MNQPTKICIKSLRTIFCFYSSTLASNAQSVGINEDASAPNPSAPHSSAILDVKSNTKGMILPRTFAISRSATVNPARGLQLYDTTTAGFWFYNDSARTLFAGNSGWSLAGNTTPLQLNH